MLAVCLCALIFESVFGCSFLSSYFLKKPDKLYKKCILSCFVSVLLDLILSFHRHFGRAALVPDGRKRLLSTKPSTQFSSVQLHSPILHQFLLIFEMYFHLNKLRLYKHFFTRCIATKK